MDIEGRFGEHIVTVPRRYPFFRTQARLWCAELLNDERPSYDDLSKENLGIGLLSHTKVCSIMGDEELDCRVRNGIGYTLFSMDTKEI